MTHPDGNPFGVDARRIKDDAFRLSRHVRIKHYIEDTSTGPGSADYDIGLALAYLKDAMEDLTFAQEHIRALRANPELLRIPEAAE